MKKALMLASVASMIDKFNMENIKILHDLGYKVDVVANFDFGSITSQERVDEFKQELVDDGINVYNIQIPRKISDIKGIINSYEKIKKLSINGEYDIIHCHSPIGGVLARLAFRKARKKGTKVIYTAHGFHFFKGAPLLNWLIYFPLEWFCSLFTDILITINKEDFDFSKKYMKAKKIKYTHGIGIDISKFGGDKCDKNAKRKEMGLPENATIFLSVGELNKNKNHELVIQALSNISSNNIFYYIAGKGYYEKHLSELAKEKMISNTVHLLGYRTDVKELLLVSDFFCFPSFREGLSVSLMEAMAAGLPVICSDIRGNVDLIDKNGGILFSPRNVQECENAIKKIMYADKQQMGKYNQNKIKDFDTKKVNEEMKKIYEEI